LLATETILHDTAPQPLDVPEPPRPTTRLSGLGQTATEIARRRKSDVRALIRLLQGDLEWIMMKARWKRTGRGDMRRRRTSPPISAVTRRASRFRSPTFA
jgi:hypothetical protein